MDASKFCTGVVPSVDECHRRGIVPVGVHAGLTYEQLLANCVDYCEMVAKERETGHLAPVANWLADKHRLEDKRKNDLDVFRDMSDEDRGDRILTAGKHRGLAYRAVVQDHPDYCRSVLSRLGAEPLSTEMRYFLEYLRTADLPEQPSDCDPEDRGACAVDFGRVHRGKRFQEVLDADPRYCRWVLSAERTGGMKLFAEFLASQGVEPEEPRPVHRA